MLVYHLGFFIPRMLAVKAASGYGNGYSFGDDFYPIWLTTRHFTADLYSSEVTRSVQKGLFGRALDPNNPKDPLSDYRQFAYPAFTDLLLFPASASDFPTVRIALAVLLPILTIINLRLWMCALQWRIKRYDFAAIAILVLCTYQVLEALFAEQPGLLVGFFVAGAAAALRGRKFLLAGLLLALTLIKPQMTLLAVIYLIVWSLSDRKRAGVWVGLSIIGLAITVSSLLIWPDWIRKWMGVILGYHHYAMPPLVSVLLGETLGTKLGPILIGALVFGALWLIRLNRQLEIDSEKFWLVLTLLLAIGTVTLVPGQAVYDHIVLIPGIFLLLKNREKLLHSGRIAQLLFIAGAVVVCWPWVSAFLLLCIRGVAASVFRSYPIFVLPIRTAASLPFAVLAVLAWMLRVTSFRTKEAS